MKQFFTRLPFLSELSFLLLFIMIFIFRIWLSSTQIMTAVGDSPEDDQLFITQAQSIVNGHWLGEYSNTTLIRGPMYSLWIASSYILHVPLLFNQQLLYISACCLLYIALRTRYKKVISFFIFCIVLFNPISYQVSERILRHHFYTSLSVGLVACILGICTPHKNKSHSIIWWSILLSVTLSMFYLTREEFLWMAPVLCIPIVYYGFQLYYHRRNFFRPACIVCCGFMVSSLFILCIAGINYLSYGAFIINEFKQGAYPKVYGDLLRIKQNSPTQYIVVPKEVVYKASRVSPHTALLESMFDGPLALWAAQYAKAEYGLDTNEITGAHFIFVLRDFVTNLGNFKTYQKSQLFFQEMHKELSTACEQKHIACWHWPFDLIPVFQKKYSIPIVQSFRKLVTMLFSLSDLRTYAYTSTGNWDNVYLFSKITRQQTIAPHYNNIGSDRIEIATAQTSSIFLLHHVYRVCGQVIISIGFICYCFLCMSIFVKKYISFSFLFITGTGAGVLLFMMLLSYIDAICFPMLNLEYASPIYPLLLLFGSLNIYEAIFYCLNHKLQHP